MRLSSHTQDILRNFSTVAQDDECCPLIVWGGNKLQAVSRSSSLVGYAEVEETFPHFVIYDLRSFIAALSIFKEPEIEFDPCIITITEAEGGKVMRYPGADLSFIKYPHDKMTPEHIAYLFDRIEDEEEGPVVEFELAWANIQDTQKATAVLAQFDKDFYFIINTDEKGTIRFGCADGKGSPQKNFFTERGKSPVRDFTAYCQRDTFIKLLAGRDYVVTANQGIVLLKAKDITYFIGTAAIDKDE
jgi:hypothetical protein